MKLYFALRTRSVRPRWLLEELEVPYELVKVDLSKQENRTADFLTLNPLGDLPVLVDGEVTLSESSAICLYLADRFPEKKLGPGPGSPERGAYLQWLLFAEATLDPLVMEHYRKIESPQHARLEEVLTSIERRVDGREFIAGGSFTAADIAMASILHLAQNLTLLEKHPKLFDYVLRQTKRPASRRAVTL